MPYRLRSQPRRVGKGADIDGVGERTVARLCPRAVPVRVHVFDAWAWRCFILRGGAESGVRAFAHPTFSPLIPAKAGIQGRELGPRDGGRRDA
jgi:hypothetical protein